MPAWIFGIGPESVHAVDGGLLRRQFAAEVIAELFDVFLDVQPFLVRSRRGTGGDGGHIEAP